MGTESAWPFRRHRTDICIDLKALLDTPVNRASSDLGLDRGDGSVDGAPVA
jgi:hypothetical protein